MGAPAVRIALVTPPVVKPSEPGLSAGSAALRLRAHGLEALAVDASLGWYRHALSQANLAAALTQAGERGYAASTCTAFRHALRSVTQPRPPLQRAETYRHRKVYSSAASHLVNALRLASVPFPGHHLRVADLEVEGARPHCSADLLGFAGRPGPFDAYFLDELLPWLERERVTHLGVSLTFLNQAFAAFRLAWLVRERLPQVKRLLGGPLPACWTAVGAPLHAPAFSLFDRVLGTSSDAEVEALALSLGGHPAPPPGVMSLDLRSTPWEHYLVPLPTVPAALGRGCYWKRCTFCPDYLHPAYHACRKDALADWLVEVAERFPGGAMLHLTDSALAPAHLERVATIILERGLPLKWHGFVRLEPRFADPGFTRHLARGGCAMLQWGLETASPRLLDLMEKGVTPDLAGRVLESAAEAGIRNHVYLLWGLPTETDVDREQTLEFVEAHATALHDLNNALLNLPRRSPMHDLPARYGVTALRPFGHETDLSLYDDFLCGPSHPRLEARRWLDHRFYKSPAVKGVIGDLNDPFKANHSCFLGR